MFPQAAIVQKLEKPRVPAADGPVYALWPSGYGSAVHEGLLLLLLCNLK
jgi:hypothetical protein